MVSRRGHSLVELIVAVTLLGVGLAATQAAMLAALRRTERLVRQERALARAAAILDSLTMEEAPRSGHREEAGLLMTWEIRGTSAGDQLLVRVDGPGVPTASLTGRRLGPVPMVPATP